MSAELHELVAVLEGLRAAVLKKLAGLSEPDARRSTVGSGTNVAGLVQHLTFAESTWFGGLVAESGARRGARSMRVDPAVTLRQLRAEYRAACEASNAAVAAVGDPDAVVQLNGRSVTPRTVLLGMIEETARHAGHADIIREQLDGRTGR